MSANIGSVVFAIQAVDEASGVMGKISASVGLLGNALIQLGPGFSQLGQIMQGFAVGGPTGAAIVGIGEVVKGLQDSITAAGASQLAWTSLQSALHLTGSAWDAMSTQLHTVVDNLRTTTTESGTNLVNALQRLATYGMTGTQAMDALGAVTELAAAKHIDLETAATAVGKAFQGNSMLLLRYGVDTGTMTQETTRASNAIKDLGDKLSTATAPQLSAFNDAITAAGLKTIEATGKLTLGQDAVKELTAAFKDGTLTGDQLNTILETMGLKFTMNTAHGSDFQGILDQINKQFGGAAQAQADTYIGLQERLGNAWTALSEKIGSMLLPALTTLAQGLLTVVGDLIAGVGAAEAWITGVEKMPEVQGAIKTVQGAFSALRSEVTGLAQDAVEKLVPASTTLGAAMLKLQDALSPLGAAIMQIASGVKTATGNFDPFKAIIDAVAAAMNGLAGFITKISPAILNLSSAIKDAVTPFQNLYQALAPLGAAIEELIGALIGMPGGIDLVAAAINALITVINGAAIAIRAVTAVVTAVTAPIKAFADGVKSAADIVTNAMNAMRSAVDSALGGIVTKFLQTVDQIIAAAQSLWSALVGHSIWTDMLSAMVSQTHDALNTIQGNFKDVLGGIAPNMAIGIQASMGAEGVGGSGSVAAAAPGPSPNLSMSVPITTTLNVDGQRIAKIVEQRSIIRRNMASAYR